MAWLYTLAGIGALFAALLAIPVQIRFSATMDGSVSGLQKAGRLRWAFGVVDVPLGGKPGTGARPRRASTPVPRPTRLDRRKLLRNPAFWSQLKRLFGKLLREVRWQAFRLEARFGMDDPADTGMLWGLLGPAVAAAVPPRANVMIQPVFDRATFAFDANGEFRVIPLKVAWLLALFFASPRTWHALKPAWRWSP